MRKRVRYPKAIIGRFRQFVKSLKEWPDSAANPKNGVRLAIMGFSMLDLDH